MVEEIPTGPRPDPYKGESILNGKIVRGHGGKVNYPKHVWSPSGGWYSRPANWKQNTAVMGAVIAGITLVAWKVSADREERTKFPEPGRFFPSRYWSKQVIEHERAQGEASQ